MPSEETKENQEEAQVDYNQGYFNMPRELRAACAQVHKNTAQLVEFIAEQTFGWHSRWVSLTYDEIKHGRKKQNGERMGPGSFLTRDAPIRRAIVDALDEERPLIEVRYLYGQTAYAIHKDFWASSKLVPMWEFFKRTSYSPYDDPIPYEQATTKKVGGKQKERETDAPPPKTSTKSVGTDYQIDSRQLPNSEKATSEMVEQNRDETRPQEARGEGIDTSLDTSSIDTKDRYEQPSASLQAGASANASRRHVLIEQEEEHGRDDGDGPPSLFAQEQALAEAKRLEELAARRLAAEEAKKRHEERLEELERLKTEIEEKERAYDGLIREELRLWGLVKKASGDDKAAKEQELAAFRATMAAPLQELEALKRARQALMG